MPENSLEINQYLVLTSYCNTIGQSNNAFFILGFSLAGKRRVLSRLYRTNQSETARTNEGKIERVRTKTPTELIVGLS